MSLAAEAAAGPPKKAGKLGAIPTWLASLSDEDRAAAEAVLANPDWSHVEARKLFQRYGLEISPQSLGVYRRDNYGPR